MIWDPINLLEPNEDWKEKSFADEYDQYLIQIAGRLRRGQTSEELVAYILAVERDVIGLCPSPIANSRAAKLTDAIRKCKDIWSD